VDLLQSSSGKENRNGGNQELIKVEGRNIIGREEIWKVKEKKVWSKKKKQKKTTPGFQ